MRSFISRTVAAALALTLLSGGVMAQSKRKKRRAVAKTTAAKTSQADAKATKTPTQPYTGDPQPPQQRPDEGDGVRRITPAEARAAQQKGTAIFVDVRNDVVYQSGHIAGAILIPFGEVAGRLKELPRNKLIITYCSWPSEHTSAGAVLTLKQNGIRNAAALLGGYQAWVSAGLPTEAAQQQWPVKS